METDLRANLYFSQLRWKIPLLQKKEYFKLGLYTICVDV